MGVLQADPERFQMVDGILDAIGKKQVLAHLTDIGLWEGREKNYLLSNLRMYVIFYRAAENMQKSIRMIEFINQTFEQVSWALIYFGVFIQ